MKPHGSGDGGGVVKIDLAVALVKHLFPLATADEHQRMAAAITWRNPENLGESERDILKYVSELDSENREAPEFTRIAKLASQKLKEKENNEMTEKVREQLQRETKEKEEKSLLEEDRKAKAASMTEEAALGNKGKSGDTSAASSSHHHGRKASETPPSLRDFLSFDMVQAKISINRDSGGYGYRAFYPGGGIFMQLSKTISGKCTETNKIIAQTTLEVQKQGLSFGSNRLTGLYCYIYIVIYDYLCIQ